MGTANSFLPTMFATNSEMSKTPEQVAQSMLDWDGLKIHSIKPLQTLWAGYGSICALTTRSKTDSFAARITKALYPDHITQPATKDTDIPLVLKYVSPPAGGRKDDEGHHRKMLSYEVERYFYASYAVELTDNAKVACLVSSIPEGTSDGVVAMVMEDLRVRFPVAGGKRAVLDDRTVRAAVDWLGSFHTESRQFRREGDMNGFVKAPLEETKFREGGGRANDKEKKATLWLNGGYTYLATRQKEYANLKADEDSEWSGALCSPIEGLGCSIAEAVAKVLTPRGRLQETFIHGDVKSENLFSSKDGTKVAFFDFQYVGLGLGVCDLAKLFTCSVPEEMLDASYEEVISASDGELKLLKQYRETLLRGREEGEYPEELFTRHWECALVDWCRFQASWGFWGNTEWLEGRVRSILRDEGWRTWLREELRECDAS